MGNPSTGHIGFCLSGNNGGKFETFEFNTSADSSAVVRDGEGAYYEIDHLKMLVTCIF